MLCPVALGGTSRFLDAVRSDCNVALLKRLEFRRRVGTRQRAMGRKESRDGVFLRFSEVPQRVVGASGINHEAGLTAVFVAVEPQRRWSICLLDRRGKPAGAGGARQLIDKEAWAFGSSARGGRSSLFLALSCLRCWRTVRSAWDFMVYV